MNEIYLVGCRNIRLNKILSYNTYSFVLFVVFGVAAEGSHYARSRSNHTQNESKKELSIARVKHNVQAHNGDRRKSSSSKHPHSEELVRGKMFPSEQRRFRGRLHRTKKSQRSNGIENTHGTQHGIGSSIFGSR